MHRVELKALIVERVETTEDLLVPNAPCGVESRFLSSSSLLLLSFLMHRVELKDGIEVTLDYHEDVPNAPCGVESSFSFPFLSGVLVCVPNAPCGVESLTVI